MQHIPSRGRVVAVVVVLAAALAGLPGGVAGAAPGTTTRVSTQADGSQSNGYASLPAMSSDGSLVVFGSTADDLVGGVNGYGASQIYAKRLDTGAVELVTASIHGGASSAEFHGEYDVDGDGSTVVFDSIGDDLSLDADDDTCTIIVREDDEEEEEDAPCNDVFARDLASGTTTKVSVGLDGAAGNGSSYQGRISDDGRYVVFGSSASNLVPGDDNGRPDIFVRDLLAGTTRRLTDTQPGTSAGDPAISADGTVVAFYSSSPDLDPSAPTGSHIYVYDLVSDDVTRLPVGATDGAQAFDPSLSGDGEVVGFMSYDELLLGDTNPSYDLYVHDRGDGTTSLVNWNADGGRAQSADRIEISDDGTHALFRGGAGLVPGTPTGRGYVYVKDLESGASRVVSLADDGSLLESGGDSGWRSLSPDGSVAAFWTGATNAVPGDTNGLDDVFVRVLGDLAPLPGNPGDLETTLDGSGEAVTTGAEAVDSVPVVASIVPPGGLTGMLTVDLESANLSAVPAGFVFFGEQLDIEGPPATADDPYVVTFTVDQTRLASVPPAEVQVFRNGAVVADCTDPADAVPDPCVQSRSATAGGDAVVTVRTSHFSEWAFGALDYTVTGPFAPVDPFPTVNTVKAGSAVPVKFRLGGDRGLDVFADGYPRTESASCGGSTDAIEQTVSAGGSSLAFDAATATYTYVWRSTKGSAGCRDLVLRFRDGGQITARFQLK